MKARKDRRNNIIVFGIKENQATNQKDKQIEDIKEIKWILNESCDVAKVICMGKYTESKKRPIMITIKKEEKKKETFQNLQKLRSIENITITHDVTKKQREELQELIREAKRKEECDPSSSYIYRVCGPPWVWFI